MAALLDILVIEADDLAIMILEKNFQLAGYSPRFTIANKWEDAKQLFTSTYFPHVIFIEPILPDYNLTNFLSWLKSRNIFANSHIYFLSVLLPPALEKICAEFSIKGYLSKPIRKEDVQLVINQLR